MASQPLSPVPYPAAARLPGGEGPVVRHHHGPRLHRAMADPPPGSTGSGPARYRPRAAPAGEDEVTQPAPCSPVLHASSKHPPGNHLRRPATPARTPAAPASDVPGDRIPQARLRLKPGPPGPVEPPPVPHPQPPQPPRRPRPPHPAPPPWPPPTPQPEPPAPPPRPRRRRPLPPPEPGPEPEPIPPPEPPPEPPPQASQRKSRPVPDFPAPAEHPRRGLAARSAPQRRRWPMGRAATASGGGTACRVPGQRTPASGAARSAALARTAPAGPQNCRPSLISSRK
jgi:hypothetical protein